LKITGKKCEGKFWEENCMFHGEHLALNEGKEK
jgi:hypothetical protein